MGDGEGPQFPDTVTLLPLSAVYVVTNMTMNFHPGCARVSSRLLKHNIFYKIGFCDYFFTSPLVYRVTPPQRPERLRALNRPLIRAK
jgi:hypothetical protein